MRLLIALMLLLLVINEVRADQITVRDFETTQLPTIKTVSNEQITVRQ